MTPKAHQRSATRRRHGTLAVVFVSYIAALSLASIPSAGAGASSEPPGFVIIVNPANPASSITQEFVAQVFFKRVTRWGHGTSIQPVDLPLQSNARRAFSLNVLKRSAPAVRGYWLQRIFSGRELPPPEMASDADVIRYVLGTPGGIGYISASAGPTPAKELALSP